MVAFQIITPTIPSDALHRRQLEEDLARIVCIGLLERPWNLWSDEMIYELISGVPNQYERTVRG